ncbi:MAG: hypothetical protein JSR33_04215 [Proteobacteria bacterium]|nr:hypothetical protein [Pseudomonadota bacterium]
MKQSVLFLKYWEVPQEYTHGVHAWTYAQNKSNFLKYSLTVTNPVSNILFLSKATDDFFDFVVIETSVPEELERFIILPKKRELILKYLKILLGSLICSIPFGISTYLFPLPNCESTECLAITVTHSMVANTILHAISWNLIFTPSFWYYRLPTLPFEFAYKKFKLALISEEKRNNLTIYNKKSLIYQKYKDHLSQFFTSAAEQIVTKHLTKASTETASSPLHLLGEQKASLMTLAGLVDAPQLTKSEQETVLRFWCLCNALSRQLNRGVGIAGAAFMVLGCIGWVANPIYIGLTEGLTLIQSILAGFLPAYSTGILCAFYGEHIIKSVYQYLISWNTNLSGKLPPEAKLFPKTFSLLLIINIFVSIFSYGTAQQLILTVFDDNYWDDIRPFLQYNAFPALQIMSFVPLLNLSNVIIRKLISKFGPEGDDKLAERLLLKASLLSQRLQQVSGEELMTGIALFDNQQKKFLGINPEEFNRDQLNLQSLESKLVEQKSYSKASNDSSCCFSFFQNKHKTQNRTQVSLLESEVSNTQSINYQTFDN